MNKYKNESVEIIAVAKIIQNWQDILPDGRISSDMQLGLETLRKVVNTTQTIIQKGCIPICESSTMLEYEETHEKPLSKQMTG